MKVRTTVFTTADCDLQGVWTEGSEQQLAELRANLREYVGGEGIDNFTLDTPEGFIVVPADKLAYIRVEVDRG